MENGERGRSKDGEGRKRKEVPNLLQFHEIKRKHVLIILK